MKKKKELNELYIELVKLQKEVISANLKLLIILEGRDTAGKDGTIKAITLHLSPRETRVVALGKPSSREEHAWYFQRYAAHLPVSGEIVLFNRSWYNRAGVEKVMEFCTAKEYKSFFKEVELFEEMLVDAGCIILKYYLDISKNEQKKRLNDRRKNPLKQWKISPIDEVALKHWENYSEARNEMLMKTSFRNTPWFVVSADNKRDAHIALIIHFLNQLSYSDKNNKLLSDKSDLIYTATQENINKRLFY